MNNWIAIDFGTSTVKAAYLDTDGEPKALELGSDRDTIPSVFHLSNDGELTIGEKAEERGEEDPKGDVPFLKRNLKKPLLKWRKRIANWWSKISGDERSDGDLQREFLVELFKDIRNHVKDRIDIFQGKPPTAVCLTVTSCYKPTQKDLLYEAARQAGFEKIDDVTEPLAAARMWREEEDIRHSHAVVLDCGGGTTDWAYVRRESSGDFQIQYEFTPGGVEFGGSDVDKELYNRVKAELKRNSNRRANRRDLMRKVRKWKEDYCNNHSVDFEYGNTRISLIPSDIQSVIDTKFIQPVFKKLKPFVEKLKKELGEESLPVLLVGGSHRLKGLEEAVDKQLGCEPFLSEHEITGPALGAVLWVHEKYRSVEESVEEPVEESVKEPVEEPVEEPRRRLEVADHFREVAKLIGDRQSKEITLASGRTVVPGLRMIGPAAALEERADRLENGSLRIAVIGIRSEGKSTLINALLGENLLRVGKKPTTAVITQIVKGKKKEVTLVEKSYKQRTISRKEFIEKCVLDSKGKVPQEFANVAYAEIQSSTCRLCKAKLQLVDTLGFENIPENDAITRRYLNEVDAVLLLISDEGPFDNEHLDLIDSVRRQGDSGLGHVFFVINDHGLDDDGKEEVLMIARDHLEHEFGESFNRHVFLTNAQKALKGRVESGKDPTTLPVFEREIEQFLKGPERVDVILDTAVRDVLSPAIAAARDRMEARKELLSQSQDEMETTISDFNAELPQLQEKVESIYNTFNDFTSNIADTIADNAISILVDLINSFEWSELDIGGHTQDYLDKAGFSQRDRLSKTIQRRIRAYFKREVSDTEFKDIDDQLRTLSDTLEEEITSFVKELNRKEAPWFIANLRKVLSTSQKRVMQRIISAYALKPSVIGNIVEQQVPKGNVKRAIAWFKRKFRRESDERIAEIRREDIKEAIREEFKAQFGLKEHAWRREIHESVVEVFTDPSEELRKDLMSELKRRQRILEDMLETKRSGIKAETARLRRLKTINICLDEAFDAICESAYGRVLTPQERQEL